MKHTYKSAFDVFATFGGGLTAAEFSDLMDTPEDRRNASARLSQFVKEGLAFKSPGGRIDGGVHRELYIPTGIPFENRKMETRDERRKRKRPTDDELVTLRKWKVDAIKRFPELGVDPLILKAREKVASILRSEGNDVKASLVERGELDDGETMRIVLSVLRA